MSFIVIANWKCNPLNSREANQIFNSLNKGLKNYLHKNSILEAAVCPPFVYLQEFKLQNSLFKLGGQDCFWEKQGAFTGEISGEMLKNLGCQYVILGHSERRIYLKETDEIINKKLKIALKIGLIPILCVGENQIERKKNITKDVLKKQLKRCLKGIQNLSGNKIQNFLFIAYEPIWAIKGFGGKAATIDDARQGILFIREILSKIFTKKAAKKIKILYGGSVTSKNASEFVHQTGGQGLLVGSASLNPKEFIKIIKAI